MALFSRLKTRNTGAIVVGSDDDAEWDNIINNMGPDGVEDASANLTAMQATADPYPGDVPSLATALRGEIHRLRYQILLIMQSLNATASNWYENVSIIFSNGITTDNIAIKTRELHIGPWDASTATGTLSVVVAHGLTVSDIRSIDILIRADTAELLSSEHEGLVNTRNGTSWVGDATDIIISRNASQFFDSTSFNLTENIIDNAAAVDKGDGTVGIPITANDFNAKDVTTIAGSINYNGTHTIVSKTANEIVITATYVAETFAGTETASWSRGWVIIGYAA